MGFGAPAFDHLRSLRSNACVTRSRSFGLHESEERSFHCAFFTARGHAEEEASILLRPTADSEERERDGDRTAKRSRRREKKMEQRAKEKRKEKKKHKKEKGRGERRAKDRTAAVAFADLAATPADDPLSNSPSKRRKMTEQPGAGQTNSTMGSPSESADAATATTTPLTPQAVASHPTTEGGVTGSAGNVGGDEMRAARAKAMVPMRPEEYAAQQKIVREVREKNGDGGGDGFWEVQQTGGKAPRFV